MMPAEDDNNVPNHSGEGSVASNASAAEQAQKQPRHARTPSEHAGIVQQVVELHDAHFRKDEELQRVRLLAVAHALAS